MLHENDYKSLGVRMKIELVNKVDEKINRIRRTEDRNVSYSEVIREALELWLDVPYKEPREV